MEKEKYKFQKQSISEQINYFQNQRRDLDSKYIEENKMFEIGDRIMDDKQNFGYVYGFEIDYADDVRPKAYKEKKDGTPSKHSMYISHYSSVILANKED